MNGDLTTLFLGAVIAIVSSTVTYFVNHLLNVREQRLKREFEITEKGRDFFHQIYGIVASLSDLVTPFLIEDDSDNLMICTEKGYMMQPKKEIIKRYKQNYERCAKAWYECREKGLEVFITEESADLLRRFWAYAGYFYETEDWEKNKEVIKKFRAISWQFCNHLDKIIGLPKRESRIPKWLNPKKWPTIIRSEKV